VQLRIRIAEGADEGAIRQVDAHARAGGAARIAFIGGAVHTARCVVAETDEIIGFAVTTPAHFFTHDFIDLLVVREDCRRRGVGRALLRASVDRASAPRVFSSTNASNAPMRSLLNAEGWSVSGQLDGLDPGDPEIVFFIDVAGV
jgi:GNAT superfamily N-acetyltransferase